MTTKIYYFFCASCGGDTATYERITSCPYCHTGGDTLQLLDDLPTAEQRQAVVRQQIEVARSKWIANRKTTRLRNKWFRKFG